MPRQTQFPIQQNRQGQRPFRAGGEFRPQSITPVIDSSAGVEEASEAQGLSQLRQALGLAAETAGAAVDVAARRVNTERQVAAAKESLSDEQSRNLVKAFDNELSTIFVDTDDPIERRRRAQLVGQTLQTGDDDIDRALNTRVNTVVARLNDQVTAEEEAARTEMESNALRRANFLLQGQQGQLLFAEYRTALGALDRNQQGVPLSPNVTAQEIFESVSVKLFDLLTTGPNALSNEDATFAVDELSAELFATANVIVAENSEVFKRSQLVENNRNYEATINAATRSFAAGPQQNFDQYLTDISAIVALNPAFGDQPSRDAAIAAALQDTMTELSTVAQNARTFTDIAELRLKLNSIKNSAAFEDEFFGSTVRQLASGLEQAVVTGYSNVYISNTQIQIEASATHPAVDPSAGITGVHAYILSGRYDRLAAQMDGAVDAIEDPRLRAAVEQNVREFESGMITQAINDLREQGNLELTGQAVIAGAPGLTDSDRTTYYNSEIGNPVRSVLAGADAVLASNGALGFEFADSTEQQLAGYAAESNTAFDPTDVFGTLTLASEALADQWAASIQRGSMPSDMGADIQSYFNSDNALGMYSALRTYMRLEGSNRLAFVNQLPANTRELIRGTFYYGAVQMTKPGMSDQEVADRMSSAYKSLQTGFEQDAADFMQRSVPFTEQMSSAAFEQLTLPAIASAFPGITDADIPGFFEQGRVDKMFENGAAVTSRLNRNAGIFLTMNDALPEYGNLTHAEKMGLAWQQALDLEAANGRHIVFGIEADEPTMYTINDPKGLLPEGHYTRNSWEAIQGATLNQLDQTLPDLQIPTDQVQSVFTSMLDTDVATFEGSFIDALNLNFNRELQLSDNAFQAQSTAETGAPSDELVVVDALEIPTAVQVTRENIVLDWSDNEGLISGDGIEVLWLDEEGLQGTPGTAYPLGVKVIPIRWLPITADRSALSVSQDRQSRNRLFQLSHADNEMRRKADQRSVPVPGPVEPRATTFSGLEQPSPEVNIPRP